MTNIIVNYAQEGSYMQNFNTFQVIPGYLMTQFFKVASR